MRRLQIGVGFRLDGDGQHEFYNGTPCGRDISSAEGARNVSGLFRLNEQNPAFRCILSLGDSAATSSFSRPPRHQFDHIAVWVGDVKAVMITPVDGL